MSSSFYTVNSLGKHRHLTPEGFLVIESVPLARTGMQMYSDQEVPVKGDSRGHVMIMREPNEVFRPETIGSLQGKPVVLNHPDDDVNPENYRKLAVGHVLNPRQGTNPYDNLLFGDLLIWCPDAINAINEDDLREVSVGYDADYQDAGEGKGYQRNIIANHLALVRDGRCGPTCRIGDSIPRQVTRDACTCDSCTHDTEVPTTSAERALEGDAPVLSIELRAMENLRHFIDFWRYVRRAASSGHSFLLEADREEHMPVFWPHEGHPKCYIDGDGADRIGKILLDGEDVTDPPDDEGSADTDDAAQRRLSVADDTSLIDVQQRAKHDNMRGRARDDGGARNRRSPKIIFHWN